MQKLILAFFFLVCSMGLTFAQSSGSINYQITIEDGPATTSVIYLVRHAEKMKSKGAMMDKDPALTKQGEARAKDLARLLKDAGIQYIYSSDYERTRSTAQPIAEMLGLEVQIYDPRKLEDLAKGIRSMGGRYLVVGHSNSTPNMVKILGGEPGKPIDDATEYDRLYTVVLQNGFEPVTVLMRYGAALQTKSKPKKSN